MAFEDVAWALAFNRGGGGRGVDPLAEMNRRAAENRRYQQALALQSIQDDRADRRVKSQYDMALALANEKELNSEVSAIEERNRKRDRIYSDAAAASASIGGTWAPDPGKSPDENEAAAQLQISKINALAARAHEAEVKEARRELEALRQKLFDASSPTPEEIGRNVADSLDFIKKDPKRLKALIEGRIDEALDGLSAEDYALAATTIAEATDALADSKAKRMKPQIESITRSIAAAEGRNADASQKAREMRNGIPAWMLVDPELIRPSSAPAKSKTADIGPTPYMPSAGMGEVRAAENEAMSIAPPAPGQPPILDNGVPVEAKNIAREIGAALLQQRGGPGPVGSFLGIPSRMDPDLPPTPDMPPIVGEPVEPPSGGGPPTVFPMRRAYVPSQEPASFLGIPWRRDAEAEARALAVPRRTALGTPMVRPTPPLAAPVPALSHEELLNILNPVQNVYPSWRGQYSPQPAPELSERELLNILNLSPGLPR